MLNGTRYAWKKCDNLISFQVSSPKINTLNKLLIKKSPQNLFQQSAGLPKESVDVLSHHITACTQRFMRRRQTDR